MKRLFRLWEKKRGRRRTGSQVVGSLGEALFFGVLFLLGSVSLATLITSHVMYPRPEELRLGFGFRLMLLVLGSLILLGAGGVVRAVLQVGASAERRSALARRAADIQLLGEVNVAREHPNIPLDANLTNSPGIRLAFRLPMSQSPAARLLAAAVFCLVWNAIAAMLVILAINSHLIGQPEWFLTFFSIPVVAVGIWSMYYFTQQMLVHTGIGPTVVEVSEHPLRPGQSYEVFLSQAGRLKLNALEVQLVCQEEATYHQGTDIRTETYTVFCQRVFYGEDFRIEPGLPLEQQMTLRIPVDVMHSFQSSHNGLHWKLVVHGDADSWPPFQRSFPIVVYPARTCRKGT